ncbi:hypothetical protein IW492_11400 [Enterococcus sp. BWB1-3]|uniref:hypothetical protein n=1 Tax=Enterococcus sp. BWB1-3 TaxID=2787713 RepID=UPI0019248793|nr:hypothetical protein [Enterococcus sp. BWB1-3]MBL1229837.1 hypothetical protein [Enterococcus sp. BWB1-3]
MDENYGFLMKFIKEIDLINEPGISADIRAFFREDEKVKDYNLNITPENIYELKISLMNPNWSEKEDIFFQFVEIMKYSGVNMFYVSHEYLNENIFVTATKNLEGVCFKIYFDN